MLTDRETTEIGALIAHLPTRESACIEAMKIVQAERGYVSDEAIADLSQALGMSTADLDSVATFYNLIFRKPVGRHVIFVCDSVSCWVMGQERVLDYLQRRLGIEPGQTTPDGQFTLLPTVCLGHCEQAPAMMLDGEIIGGLTEEKIESVLSQAARTSEGV